jgi:hypothetical protein
VKNCVFLVCGIVLSNKDVPSAIPTVSIIISMCKLSELELGKVKLIWNK